MDFQTILNRHYMVKVKVSKEYNILQNKPFTVENLTENEDIISQYKNQALNVISINLNFVL